MNKSPAPPKIGIIGGSGLYHVSDLKRTEWKKIRTPFGNPSDEFLTGVWQDRPVVFLPRHGRGHRLAPHEINHQANVWAMKTLGVGRIISISAVGSLQAKYKPMDLVFPDSFLDRTKKSSEHTFFGKGIVAHVSFADPVCRELQRCLHQAACSEMDRKHLHLGGTYVNMEGPAFSTRAESEFYRKLDADVIGMTNLAEAKLSREAEICYANIAMVTDYDCWKTDEEPVTADLVIERLQKNVENAKRILKEALPKIPDSRGCACGDALRHSIVTGREHWPKETLEALQPILNKYV